MSLATTPFQLLALRLTQGFFSGFIAPSLTLVSVQTPADRQGRVAGLLHTSFLAGGVLGPLMGGLMADMIGMRMVFLVTASMSLLSATLTMLFVREDASTRHASTERLTPGLLLRSTVKDILTFASSGTLRAVLLAVFVVRMGHALIDPVLALYVDTLGGYDPAFLATVTGFLFGLFGVATILLSPFWGRLCDRAGPDRLLLMCATGAALTCLPQAFVHSIGPLAVLRFLSGAFMAGVLPAAYSITASESPVERRGSAYGFTFSSLVLANAIGPASGGALAAVIGIRSLIVVAATMMFGAAIGVGLRNRRRARAAAI
jgi:DHA1 family multidrug resistance protein-like MFS transporter